MESNANPPPSSLSYVNGFHMIASDLSRHPDRSQFNPSDRGRPSRLRSSWLFPYHRPSRLSIVFKTTGTTQTIIWKSGLRTITGLPANYTFFLIFEVSISPQFYSRVRPLASKKRTGVRGKENSNQSCRTEWQRNARGTTGIAQRRKARRSSWLVFLPTDGAQNRCLLVNVVRVFFYVIIDFLVNWAKINN